MGSRQFRQHCQLSPESNGYHEHAMEEINFSALRMIGFSKSLGDSPIYQVRWTSGQMTSWRPSNIARFNGSCLVDLPLR
jgi:hypothetical protein